MNVAQVLLTHDDLECRERYLNAKRTFVTLLKLGMIPIVNENDTVSTEEIRFGDNDRLSAEVAGLVGADTLVLLSDVEGLFTDDPKTNPSAKLISTVEAVGESLLGSFSESKSQHGTGGIRSKILAAKIATELGLGVWILPGHKEDVLCQALVESKEDGGRSFCPPKTRSTRKGTGFTIRSRSKARSSSMRAAKKRSYSRARVFLLKGLSMFEGIFQAEHGLDSQCRRPVPRQRALRPLFSRVTGCSWP